MKIKLALLLAMQLLAFSGHSQTEPYWVALKISSIQPKSGKQILITINHGTEIGLKPGQSAELWATRQRGRSKEAHNVTNVVLQEVSPGKATVLTEANEPIYENDILFVQIPVRAGFHSSYFFLTTYNIVLTDNEEKPYYSFEEILKSDGYPLRTQKFVAMQQAINAEGAQLKKSGNTQKVKAGPKKGQFVHDVMASADTLAVWSFLYHLTMDYPNTLGQTFPLIQKYQDYVTEGDMTTSAELKGLFSRAKPEEWEQHYEAYKQRIDKTWVSDWVNDAKDARKNEDYATAEAILKPSNFLIAKFGDTYNEAVYSYELAIVYDNQKLYDQAIPWYLNSAKQFKQTKSDFGEGYAQTYLGRAYERTGKIKEAIVCYDKAIELRTLVANEEPTNESYQTDLFTAYDFRATLATNQDDYEEALHVYGMALEVAKKLNSLSNQADIYWNTGFTYAEKLKQSEAGIENYEKAIQLYSALQDTASMIELKRNQAINYNKLNNLPLAKARIAEAVALGHAWINPAKLAYALDYQGLLHYEKTEYKQALISYQESEKIYQSLKDSAKLISTKKNISKALRDSKHIQPAIVKTQEIFPLLRVDNLSGKADALWDLAYLHGKDYAHDFKKSISYYQESLKIYTQLKDTTNQATVLNNIAYQYKDANDSLNAYKHHQQAIRLTNTKNQASAQADSYERLGFSYKRFNNHNKSLAAHLESLRLYKLAGDLKKSGNAAENVADTYVDLKLFSQAGEYYQQSIDLYKQLGEPSEIAESYWDLGYNLGQNERQYEGGIRNYRIAYDLYMSVGDSVNASVMLSNIGQNYWSELKYDKAIDSHRAAIELASLCKNYKQVASSWSKLASLYTESNNPIGSTEALNNAANALQLVNDSTLLSSVYNDLGASYGKAKNYQKSIDAYNKAIIIRKAQKDSLNWASSIHSLAGIYQNKSEFKEAVSYYNQALGIQRKIKDQSGIVYSLVNLGTIAQSDESNYTKANTYFQEAINLATRIKDEYILAYCYLRVKGLYRAQGKSAEADAHIKKALDLYIKNKYWKDVATTYVEMSSDASYVYGDTEKAIQLVDKGQAIADTLNDVFLKAYVIGTRGNIMRETGEFQKALALVDESARLYEQLENRWGIAGIHIDRGNIYKQLSEYQLALKNQLEADSIYQVIKSEYSRLAPLANIGEIYTSQGDYKKGLEYYEKSYTIMKKANDQNENMAIIQASIGESYYYLNDFTKSDQWLRESLTTCNKIGAMRAKADALAVMGRLKIEEKKFDEAARYITEGLALSKQKNLKISYVNNLTLAGQLEVMRKNYTKARSLLEEGIKTSQDMSKYSTLWESLYWLGVLYKENKQLPESKKYLTQSVEVIEKIRNKVSGGEEARKLFSSDKNIMKVYEALVDVLLQLGEPDLAMSYIQKNNEDNLKAKFKGLTVKFENEDKNKILTQERDMKAKLDGIEQQIANEKALPSEKQNLEKLKNLEGTKTIAETDYLKFVNQQVNVRPELSKYFNNSVQPAQLKGKKKQIPTDMALLSYLPGENQLYIFVATSDTVIAKVVNVPRSTLMRNINAALNLVRTNQGTFDNITLNTEANERGERATSLKQTEIERVPLELLYQYLITPAFDEIKLKKRLCIIPNGALSYIPFQLLGKTLANGKFSLLINQYSVFYANSTDMLLRSTDEEARTFNILAFANPDKTLPATEKEVAELKRLFPDASVFVREAATEDKAKYAGGKYNVMHFATHGNLDYEDFAKSYLTMASNPTKDEDGMLTLEELWGMDVMSHLNIVVLSACQTAVSKGSDESSPVSPASGFLQNGVKSVVATLWKVDDEATSLLMSEFYKNIKTMDAIDALRQAQVTLSNNPKFAHPYYWAAAVLLGDWR